MQCAYKRQTVEEVAHGHQVVGAGLDPVEVSEIDPRNPLPRTAQKFLGKVQPHHRMPALREGAGQKASTGGQVEHAELGRQRKADTALPRFVGSSMLFANAQGQMALFVLVENYW